MPRNESETRAELIDPQLTAAGWAVVEASRVNREYRINNGRLEGQGGRRAKHDIADYILVYRNHKIGVIEAKPEDDNYTEGVAQAKKYAEKLKVRFTYSTNGRKIYEIDMQTGKERDIESFPTPDELWARTYEQPNEWRDRFAAIPAPELGGTKPVRYYQDIAVDRVLESVANDKKRILLTLATGTGKTFIAFQICWKLFNAKWNLSGKPTRDPRILFLADRNTLATQAFNEFTGMSAFEPDAMLRVDPESIKKKKGVPKNGSIFFTIFQTFMTSPKKDGAAAEVSDDDEEEGASEVKFNFGQYPPDFFDLIIIDECHRGGANSESTWRGILEYFEPAVQLGLTATPKKVENANTYTYFGEPVYSYSLKDGINDGFLTPFKVRRIQTTADEYTYTPDDTVLAGEVEVGETFVKKDFNKRIIIPERERYLVETFMSMIDQREKTLVFCNNQAHAALIRDFINQVKTHPDPNYCVRVTANDGAAGEALLREFQDNERAIPTILTTSHKLSTGVDARNVRNIVLLRDISSMIEFKQIIGRGTRLFEGKDYFTIYDFFDAHHHFSDPDWDGEPVDMPNEEPVEKGKRKPKLEPAPGPDPEPRPSKIEIKLADGKARRLQHMFSTSYYDASGKPLSAAEFLESLYGALPEFFKDEKELRSIWSVPETRKKLLSSLESAGFDQGKLEFIQKAIDAENSDLYDVLAYARFALPPIPREERANFASKQIGEKFTDKQQAFLKFVLSHYVTVGVGELAVEKINELIDLKYGSVQDAVEQLGQPTIIRSVFSDFQRYLYSPQRS